MQHADHVALIRAGVEGAGPRWLELGAGDGEFTLALAEVLGGIGDVVAMDLDRWALTELAGRIDGRFPDTTLETITGDFTTSLPPGPFDGVLAANSLHFVERVGPVLASIHGVLRQEARLVIVEYDADRGNPWVPHPDLARATRRPACAARGSRTPSSSTACPAGSSARSTAR